MLLVSPLYRHVTGVAFVSTCYWCQLCIEMLQVSPLYRHVTGVAFVSTCYWCQLGNRGLDAKATVQYTIQAQTCTFVEN